MIPVLEMDVNPARLLPIRVLNLGEILAFNV